MPIKLDDSEPLVRRETSAGHIPFAEKESPNLSPNPGQEFSLNRVEYGEEDDPFAEPNLHGDPQNQAELTLPRLSPAASKRVLRLRELEGEAMLGLRLKVRGGGCSGYQYDFSLEKHGPSADKAHYLDDRKDDNDDIVINGEGGACLWLDRPSLPFLDGATIDYEDNLSGAMFVVKNPQSKSSCGCGVSFSL